MINNLISKALIDPYINHDEFVLLREYNEMKETITNHENAVECTIKKKKMYCVSCEKTTGNKYYSVRRTKQIRLKFVSNFRICGKKKSRLIYVASKL